MSMISSKLDPVAQNTVWEEHVKKELRTLRQNETYMLTDPRKSKPCRVPRGAPALLGCTTTVPLFRNAFTAV